MAFVLIANWNQFITISNELLIAFNNDFDFLDPKIAPKVWQKVISLFVSVRCRDVIELKGIAWKRSAKTHETSDRLVIDLSIVCETPLIGRDFHSN